MRLLTSMNSRNDIFGQCMPCVVVFYYIPYLFYHLKLLTADESGRVGSSRVVLVYDYALPKSHLYYFHPLSRNAG